MFLLFFFLLLFIFFLSFGSTRFIFTICYLIIALYFLLDLVPSFFFFAQHTPVLFTGTISVGHIKYVAFHASEWSPLKWLGEEICQHIFCGTLCYFDFPLLYLVRHKK